MASSTRWNPTASPRGSPCARYALSGRESYRVDGQKRQLVVRAAVFGSNLLSLQVPAEKGKNQTERFTKRTLDCLCCCSGHRIPLCRQRCRDQALCTSVFCLREPAPGLGRQQGAGQERSRRQCRGKCFQLSLKRSV